MHELALRLLSGLGRTQWQVHSPPARQLGGVDLLLVAAPATARDAFQVRKRPGQGRRHVTNSSTGRCASRAYQKKFRLAALGVRFADCGWLSIAPVLQPKDMPASSKRLRAMQEAGRPVVSTLPSQRKGSISSWNECSQALTRSHVMFTTASSCSWAASDRHEHEGCARLGSVGDRHEGCAQP